MLSRHVKGHGKVSTARLTPSIQNKEPISESHGQFRERNVQQDGHAVASYDLAGDSSQARQVDFERWDGLSSFPLGQQNPVAESSSSLLWPDSEDLFQSLTSNDGDPWDSTMSRQSAVPFFDLSQAQALPTPSENAAITDDGQRAVQATNGLLTNTVGHCMQTSA